MYMLEQHIRIIVENLWASNGLFGSALQAQKLARYNLLVVALNFKAEALEYTVAAAYHLVGSSNDELGLERFIKVTSMNYTIRQCSSEMRLHSVDDE